MSRWIHVFIYKHIHKFIIFRSISVHMYNREKLISTKNNTNYIQTVNSLQSLLKTLIHSTLKSCFVPLFSLEFSVLQYFNYCLWHNS